MSMASAHRRIKGLSGKGSILSLAKKFPETYDNGAHVYRGRSGSMPASSFFLRHVRLILQSSRGDLGVVGSLAGKWAGVKTYR
jgi:hypothetical protein